MNLFRQHSQQNETQSKAAMEKVAFKIISKYIVAQEMLNLTLVAGHQKTGGPCLMCKIDKITKVMSKLESQVAQIEKTYKLLFNEDMPISDITEAASVEYYPLTTARGSRRRPVNGDDMPDFSEIFKSNGNGHDHSHEDGSATRTFNINDKWPDDMPEGVREAMAKIKKAIKDLPNDKVDVQVVEMKGGKGTTFFGVNPHDYDSANAFIRAVNKAKNTYVKEEVMKGEDIIKENVIHNTEDFVEHVKEEAAAKPKRTPKAKAKPDTDQKLNT